MEKLDKAEAQTPATRSGEAAHATTTAVSPQGPQGAAALKNIMSAEDALHVRGLSDAQRLSEAALFGVKDLPQELLHDLIASLPWLVAFWAISHLFGVGEILDILGLAMLGTQAVIAVGDLIEYHRLATHAGSTKDLEAAGQHLAAAVAGIGLLALFGAVRMIPRLRAAITGDKLKPIAAPGAPPPPEVAASTASAQASVATAPAAAVPGTSLVVSSAGADHVNFPAPRVESSGRASTAPGRRPGATEGRGAPPDQLRVLAESIVDAYRRGASPEEITMMFGGTKGKAYRQLLKNNPKASENQGGDLETLEEQAITILWRAHDASPGNHADVDFHEGRAGLEMDALPQHQAFGALAARWHRFTIRPEEVDVAALGRAARALRSVVATSRGFKQKDAMVKALDVMAQECEAEVIQQAKAPPGKLATVSLKVAVVVLGLLLAAGVAWSELDADAGQ